MTKPKIGLLPLYLELYDQVIESARPRMEEFYSTVASAFAARDVDVVTAPVCRLKAEFDEAVRSFEKCGADCIVTLHLAYSPSLEVIDALAGTKLPIIVLDTTPTYNHAPDQDPAEVMYNHGIHGVQDMCNLLIRRGKRFQIEAGHWRESDVLDRVTDWANAARLAAGMRNARIGRIGEQFKGMGDFAVEPDVLRSTIGVETVIADFAVLKALLPDVADAVVEAEIFDDLKQFDAVNVDPESHIRTTRASVAVRRWIKQENLTGFTMNFDVINRSTGMPTVPFLEASKAMARGLGYAGEGDVLTAALVGALASVYPETSFTEMFCPDWENNTIFLSHMGEINLDLLEDKAVLMSKSFPWLDTDDPSLAVGRFKGGTAVFVNLAPGPDESYTLIIVPVMMVGKNGSDRMVETVRGWFEPPMPIADFLSDYSRFGGTHHAALVYGDVLEDLVRFGELMDWNVAVLE